MSSEYISWGSVTNGLKGVASKRKERRQARRKADAESKRTRQEKPKLACAVGSKPVVKRYSAYDEYPHEYDDSCCSDSDCGEGPYDHDYFGMCAQNYGVYHGSKKQTKSKRGSAHSTKPKASGKDLYRLAKNSLSS